MSEEKRVVFIEGFKVNLRPLNVETDLDFAVKWINDYEVVRNTLSYLPFSHAKERAWLEGLYKSDTDIPLAIETKEGTFIGIMGIHGIKWRDRIATTGAMIGDKESQRKGYGTDAKMHLLWYAFEVLNLRKICSEALAFNRASIKYNEKCGYVVEGCRKQQRFRDGKYVDVILTACFKDTWQAKWEEYKNTMSK